MMDKQYLGIFFWIILGLFFGLALFFLLVQVPPQPPPQNNATLNETPGQVPEAINITIIAAPDCDRCDSATVLLEQLQDVAPVYNVTVGQVTTIDAASPQAVSLISRYGIKKLPTMIISSNIQSNQQFLSIWQSNIGTRESDGSLVFRALYLPYYDTEKQSVVGLVKGIAINATSCEECIDASAFFVSLESEIVGMQFSNETLLQETDQEAEALIAQHNITKLPTLLLSEDALAYDFFNQSIVKYGTIENGWFVLRNVTPPYVDLEANHSVRGILQSILLVNSSCGECFNMSLFANYIESSRGLFIKNTTTYEINSSEGTALVSRYNITSIPTVLYPPEAAIYPGFEDFWFAQNNTRESDGWYVFRAQHLLALPYQNLTG